MVLKIVVSHECETKFLSVYSPRGVLVLLVYEQFKSLVLLMENASVVQVYMYAICRTYAIELCCLCSKNILK